MISDAALKQITTGLPELILSLPEKERLAAWRNFLKYAAAFTNLPGVVDSS